MDAAAVDPRVSRVVDVKTLASGESTRNRLEDLTLLGERDQVKVVLCSRDDYEWARTCCATGRGGSPATCFSRRAGGKWNHVTWRSGFLPTGWTSGCRYSCTSTSGATSRADERRPDRRLAAVRGSARLGRARLGHLSGNRTFRGFRCCALSFAYGQRHVAELQAAESVAQIGAAQHRVMNMDLRAIGGSALTDAASPSRAPDRGGIPVTYVPARNTIFLALALGWAEVLGARDIFIGVNAVDYSGYPDCRPEFIRAFESSPISRPGRASRGRGFASARPLIDLSKAEIIARGIELGVDYAMTVSCYLADAAGRACGRCDSCRLRAAGFAAAGIADPTPYQG